MDGKLFVLGALVLMLAFGCTGNNTPPTQSQPGQQPTVAAGQASSQIQLGDADISQDTEPNENLLSTSDLVPPDNSSISVVTQETSSGSVSSNVSISSSDIDVIQDNESDVISAQDVVGPS